MKFEVLEKALLYLTENEGGHAVYTEGRVDIRLRGQMVT